ncbi:hypothetical protein [Streptomyces marianii]|uniref:Uncharacterized protein n=1 Tax=Streptomyces marianii TaxID=1817406 RepID=A0A5R9EAH2_9ACTN|nr:hypothetical protein [Streptomyces marianii]TLQ45782.1 hypothetical protein FEF34_24790 [Streptomyces marianii]
MSRRRARPSVPHRRVGCPTGRPRFVDELAARMAVVDRQRQSNQAHVPEPCMKCLGWHLYRARP